MDWKKEIDKEFNGAKEKAEESIDKYKKACKVWFAIQEKKIAEEQKRIEEEERKKQEQIQNDGRLSEEKRREKLEQAQAEAAKDRMQVAEQPSGAMKMKKVKELRVENYPALLKWFMSNYSHFEQAVTLNTVYLKKLVDTGVAVDGVEIVTKNVMSR